MNLDKTVEFASTPMMMRWSKREGSRKQQPEETLMEIKKRKKKYLSRGEANLADQKLTMVKFKFKLWCGWSNGGEWFNVNLNR